MSAASAVLDAVRAIQFLEATGHPDPILLLYYPAWPANPFQRLLYGETWSRGIAAIPIEEIDEVDGVLDVVRDRATVVLHLHWLGPVTERARDRVEAGARGMAFLETLDRYGKRGCRITWTIHNVLPHDARYEEEAVHVRRGVVERASLIHAMTATTPEAAAPWFELPPERLVVIPHPSYIGVYPEPPGREGARFELGLWPDEIVLLSFGQIRPYKGLSMLLGTWKAASSGLPSARRLVVAGKPTRGPDIDPLLLALEAAPDVLAVPRRIETDQVGAFFRAADVAVLSHLQALNSGVLFLALTFGLPLIAPRGPITSELLDEQVARLYTPGDEEDLAAALRQAPDLVASDAAIRAKEIAARHDPVQISGRFAEELRRHLGRG